VNADAIKFPVDVALLEKGSVIPASVIEAAYQTSRDRADYSLKVLRCIDEIQRQLGSRGAGWVIRQRDHGIRILTDKEASVLLASEVDASLRSVGRSHALQIAVDTSGFDDSESSAHSSRLLRSGAFVQAIAATRKKLRQIDRQAAPTAIENDTRGAAEAQASASAAKKAQAAARIASPRSD
jgi:hypothetical protein